MVKLQANHHKVILLIIALFVLSSGIMFGTKLNGSLRGTDSMAVMTFALNMLGVVLLILIYTQVLHIKEHMTESTTNQPLQQELPARQTRRR